MLKFGFELEGFARTADFIVIPPNGWDTDGFPGLVELRTTGGKSIEDAFGELYSKYLELDQSSFMFTSSVFEHTFTGKEYSELRRSHTWDKDNIDVKNIYGRSPRRVGNKTLASFQINVSNLISPAYKNKDGTEFPARYGLVDINSVVKNLDKMFAEEIILSKRQPGMYAIKDDYRLEYRSLPSSVCLLEYTSSVKKLIDKIKSALD